MVRKRYNRRTTAAIATIIRNSKRNGMITNIRTGQAIYINTQEQFISGRTTIGTPTVNISRRNCSNPVEISFDVNRIVGTTNSGRRSDILNRYQLIFQTYIAASIFCGPGS